MRVLCCMSAHDAVARWAVGKLSCCLTCMTVSYNCLPVLWIFSGMPSKTEASSFFSICLLVSLMVDSSSSSFFTASRNAQRGGEAAVSYAAAEVVSSANSEWQYG